MGSEEDLLVLPDQPAPDSARSVRDLTEWIKDNQKVTFTRTQTPSGDEPAFYNVSTMGGYMNNGLPKMELLTWENQPTPKICNWPYRPLSSLGEITVEFNGDPGRMADLYGLSTTLFLVSEKVLDLIRERDSLAVEVSKPNMIGAHASHIAPYWVVMPCRMFDAVDISKSNVEVRRPAIYRGADRYVTHVYYPKGYVFRDELPADVCCFVEEFLYGWYWHKSLIRAAAESGIRGLLFGYDQVRNVSDEIRLRGPADPLNW